MISSSHKLIDPDLLKLSQRIKHFRKLIRLSQAMLASRMGRDKQTIQRLEAGKVNPGFLLLRDISESMKVPLYVLLDINNEIK